MAKKARRPPTSFPSKPANYKNSGRAPAPPGFWYACVSVTLNLSEVVLIYHFSKEYHSVKQENVNLKKLHLTGFVNIVNL